MAIAGILLAAGSANRMGRNKLLLELDGEPLVRRAARRALEAGLDPLLVVVGHEAEAVRAALSGLGCRLVDNPEWRRGQSSSLSVGAAAVPPDAEAAVVLLADMPFVEAATIRAVGARWRETGAPIVSSRYGDVPAPPTLYARSMLPELQGGEGEGRGREVVRRHPERVAWVELATAALGDVDFPEDLMRARAAPGPEERATTDDAMVLDRAAAWSDAGMGVALATVTSTWGSALRPTGSQLAVNDRGDFAGSVSGGCIEAAVVQEALEVIRDGKSRRLAYGVTNERAWELGMACGGQIEVYAERVANRMGRDVLHHLRGDVQARRQAVLCTWLATGEARLLHPVDPGDDAEPALLAHARDAALRDRSRTVDAAEGAVFLRVYNPPVRLVLVGAVHIAQALAPMARLAGLDVIVVDPRRAFATAGRFPGVKVESDWPAPALARIGLDRRTAVVTLSHDPKIDDPALVAALRSEAFHVGALGSKKTQAARRERMRGEGFNEADVARIHGPAGLAIGAVSPGEIAVSILAEVVARMHGPGTSDLA